MHEEKYLENTSLNIPILPGYKTTHMGYIRKMPNLYLYKIRKYPKLKNLSSTFTE